MFVQAAEIRLLDQYCKELHVLTCSLHTFEKFSFDCLILWPWEFEVSKLLFWDIGSCEPAKFSPLVLLKPATYAVTVGVSDRPGVHDALLSFLRNYPDSYYSTKIGDGYTIVHQWWKINEKIYINPFEQIFMVSQKKSKFEVIRKLWEFILISDKWNSLVV